MTFEETYAAQWRKDAYAEGHRRGLPVKANFGTTKANIEARAEVLDALIARHLYPIGIHVTTDILPP